MTEKVTLPAEVVRALDENKGDAILYDVEAMAHSGYGSLVRIYKFYQKDPRKYFEALVNGYQVEPNPEEKVRDYFVGLVKAEDFHEYNGMSGSQFRQGWQSVKETLDLLEIKIEGVNA